MNINEILNQIERALKDGWSEPLGCRTREEARTIIDAYRQMEARAKAAEYVVDCYGIEIQALNAEIKRLESSRDGYARKSDAHEKIAGEWQARAEAAEAKVEGLSEVLEEAADWMEDEFADHGDEDRPEKHMLAKMKAALAATENTDE